MPAGLVLLTPTSVTKTGLVSTATIGANGTVTFSTCASLIVNGVFTSTYDNYRVVFRGTASAVDSIYTRFSSGGTVSTGAYYYEQQYDVSGTSVTGQRNSTVTSTIIGLVGLGTTGLVLDIYAPQLSVNTAFRGVSVYPGTGNATVIIREYAGTYAQSTSWDGFRILGALGETLSGTLSVYGWSD